MAYTTIDDPSAHFQTLLYTGDASSSLALTFDGNSNLQPDFVWNKERASTGWHVITDTTRGLTKTFYPNDDNAEETYTDRILSIQSNGFTIGDDTGTMNKDNGIYANWCWKANGGTRTTNTESGNNPAGGYQANTTAGFSIVDYTGTGATGTMAHGLSAVPKFIIFKTRATGNFNVYHEGIGSTHYLLLSNNEAKTDSNARFNDTDPTSTVFTLDTAADVNGDGTTYMAYCFAEIQGYSKFGTYHGNGAADGPFVYCGFKPSWVLRKRTDNAQQWQLYDNKRPGIGNGDMHELYPDSSEAEGTSDGIDFLSNGFKVRVSNGGMNTDDAHHVYMAFAESPFVSSEGIPTTAR